MDLFAAINPLLVVSGFVVGMLVGLTGVGGGSLMTPILVLLFGVHATTAVGTDLLYAAITKTGGTLTHGLKGTVDWRVTGRLAAGSIPATILTLFALHTLGIKGNASPPLITTVLGIAETIGEWRDRTASLPRRTPAGRRIAICPATYSNATCKTCGACALVRDAVIGFPAHGAWRQVEEATVARDVAVGEPWIFPEHRTMAEVLADETAAA